MFSESGVPDRPEPVVETDDPLAGVADPDDLDDSDFLAEPDQFSYDELDDYGEPPGDDPYLSTGGEFGNSEPVLLVWPRPEFEAIDQRWPEVLEPIGTESWDAYRRHYQGLIIRWTGRGLPLSMVSGTADGFAGWLMEQGADPLRVDLVAMADAYGGYLTEQGTVVELPPAGDDPCWCGSGVAYRHCCQRLPRA